MSEAAVSLVTLQRLPGHVALVTLNRPEARNAVNAGLAAALEGVVDATENDDDIWAVVLAGAGRGVFCAGADLKEVAAGQGAELFRPRGGFAGFVDAERSKPWIAAVNGKALAGGFEIVLACELYWQRCPKPTTSRFGSVAISSPKRSPDPCLRSGDTGMITNGLVEPPGSLTRRA